MKHFLVYMVCIIQFAFGFVDYTKTTQIIGHCNPDTVMSEEEDDLLIETSFENSINFEHVWKSKDNIDSFLIGDDYISVRGTTLDPDDINFEFDIDGITIVWKELGSGLLLDYTHLDLAARGENDLRPIYPILRKHIKLQDYTERGLDAFRHSVGCKINLSRRLGNLAWFHAKNNLQYRIFQSNHSAISLEQYFSFENPFPE